MKKEIVICAAVKFQDEVFLGHRHNHALSVLNDRLSYEHSRKEIMSMQREERVWQGFITSENRYVDRDEGLRLQKEAGIKSFRGAYQNQLYSEDLY